MAYVSGSEEDEFPPVEIIIQNHRHKLCTDAELGGEDDNDKENALTARQQQQQQQQQQPGSPVQQSSFTTSDIIGIGKTPATARRIRKLGGHTQQHGQSVAKSLRKPWLNNNNANERGESSSISSSSRETSVMTNNTTVTSFAGDMLDRLPVKAKPATMFDSPPPEERRGGRRRLISWAEKKKAEFLTFREPKDLLLLDSDDEFDGRNKSLAKKKSRAKDDDLDFLLDGVKNIRKWDSDSDDDDDEDDDDALSISPARRQPRRLQKRVLSSTSTADPSKNFTHRKAIPQDPEISPKKRAAKQQNVQAMEPAPAPAPEKGLEDIFDKLKIFGEDDQSEDAPPAATRPSSSGEEEKKAPPILKPLTPRKTLPKSPVKAPIIPPSPWKPEEKEFWDPEVNFSWIDKHSPMKPKTPSPALDMPAASEKLKQKYATSPEKKAAKKTFDAIKEQLASSFLLELDAVVTKGRLGEMTEETGGLRIEWSNTLLTTAGRAHWRCQTTTYTTKNPGGSSASTEVTKSKHYAHIQLATKVLSNESALLNTVAHEFCHLAVYLLHGKPKQPHGPEFKAYGQKVTDAAALTTPRKHGVSINVTVCHSFDIDYKFIWKCTKCPAEVKRHSRSINPLQQRCGRCYGKFVQVKPVPRGGGTLVGEAKSKAKAKGEVKVEIKTTTTEKKERKRSAYQDFTAKEMKALSISHKGLSFKDKMALVSARWGEHQKKVKEGTATTTATVVEIVEIEDDDDEEEEDDDDPFQDLADGVKGMGIKDE
ncbi:hypothetical protein GGS20DRAFT_535034 [Poronia punctata]|nr:hypothetical protein GGS20DRAFT_535034 [Poronia punctata]